MVDKPSTNEHEETNALISFSIRDAPFVVISVWRFSMSSSSDFESETLRRLYGLVFGGKNISVLKAKIFFAAMGKVTGLLRRYVCARCSERALEVSFNYHSPINY